jgi:hypothetical protein
MSWEEQLTAKMKITTGDGSIYEPLYRVDDNKYSYDFNISEFEFPEVTGTKVDRRLPKGRRFPLVLYFQGSDNFDQAEAFRISSNNLNPWTVLHPIFGQIIGHPLSLGFDNSRINVTKINVTVVESITDDGPRTTADAKETALLATDTSRETNNAFLIAGVTDPEVTDVTLMNSNVDDLYNEGSKSIGDSEIAAEYFNLFSEATNAINVALNDFGSAVNAVNAFIIYPAQFLVEVKLRFNTLKNQALALSATIENLTTPNEKKIFESQKGALVSAAIETVLTPVGDEYKSAVDVLFIMEETLTLYNDFIDELNTLQTPNGTETDSYLPDYQFMFDLNYAANYAVSNLLAIALSAQQERIVYLEADSNLIIQAHRFYGLSSDDNEELYRFINTNNIEFREYLQLKKGRKLKYYV